MRDRRKRSISGGRATYQAREGPGMRLLDIAAEALRFVAPLLSGQGCNPVDALSGKLRHIASYRMASFVSPRASVRGLIATQLRSLVCAARKSVFGLTRGDFCAANTTPSLIHAFRLGMVESNG